MQYIFIFLITYLIGSIPFGYLIGQLNRVDIRTVGSKNIGATNVLRTFGKKWGIFCFSLDFFKGFSPVFIVSKTFNQIDFPYSVLIAVCGVVFGHIFTCFLKFRGGKGVATTAGALLAIAPLPILCGLFTWFITLKLTGYVSFGSIIAGMIVPILVLTNAFNYQYSVPIKGLFIALAFLVILRHRTNIVRLINGSENKFGKKSEGKNDFF